MQKNPEMEAKKIGGGADFCGSKKSEPSQKGGWRTWQRDVSEKKLRHRSCAKELKFPRES